MPESGMTLLLLTTALTMGVDPFPDPNPPAPALPAKKREPLHPVERMRARVAELALPGTGKPIPAGSYLWQPSYELDHVQRGPARPYMLQPGDIVLAADTSVFWKLMHNLAGTSDPTHSMIVF